MNPIFGEILTFPWRRN